MRRHYLIAIVLVIGVALTSFFLFRKNSGGGPEEGGGLIRSAEIIPLDSALIPPGAELSLGTAEGTVLVNNFYQVAEGFNGDALVIYSEPAYQILYNVENSIFGLYVTGVKPKEALTEVESRFLSQLGISPKDACRLDVEVYGVVPAFDGTTRRLSFCL